MKLWRRAWCRVYQKGMYVGMQALRWPEPKRLDALTDIRGVLADGHVEKPLLVTDAGIVKAGLLDKLVAALEGMPYAVYADTVANPTVDNIETALALYQREGCDGLIALGGGSPMDCAKAIGARVARPQKALKDMRGQMKVLRRIPLLVAVPTTAGTGSETTLAAVVLDTQTHEKYAINDTFLIPKYAVLDASLTLGLPPHITAQTGMDALTHAIEAFIGHGNTGKTRNDSLDAVFLIHQYLLQAYANGADMEARKGMQQAAYLAGRAFTRAFVGYVHAIAHQLGALYGTPHGLANAMILPHMLAAYGDAVHGPLAELYEAFGGQNLALEEAGKAAYVLEQIRAMNDAMGIPAKVSGIREEDVERIAAGADREANPLYPVPRLMDAGELAAVIRGMMA